jgi:hypothetical protein
MADPVYMVDTKIYNGGYEIQGSLREIHFTLSNGELADDRFGDVLEAKYPGRVDPQVSAKGFYSASTLANGEPDPVFFARLHSDVTSWPLTLCPPQAPATAAGADGNLAYTITGAEFEYSIGAQAGELLPYSIKKLPRSGGTVSRGTVLLPKATYAATTTGTGRNLGAITAAQKFVAVLHVFAITGGSWVLTVESDDNSGFTTPLTRGTFTAVTTAPNRLVVEVNGAITDNWWRVVLTKTGGTSINAFASFGIVPIP